MRCDSAGWGIDLDSPKESGLLRIVCDYPEVASLEDHFIRIRRAIEEHKPDRLVIDSTGVLVGEPAVHEPALRTLSPASTPSSARPTDTKEARHAIPCAGSPDHRDRHQQLEAEHRRHHQRGQASADQRRLGGYRPVRAASRRAPRMSAVEAAPGSW